MSCSQPETSAASPHQWIIPFFSTPRANTLFHIDWSPPLPGKIWTAWNSSLSLSALQRTNQTQDPQTTTRLNSTTMSTTCYRSQIRPPRRRLLHLSSSRVVVVVVVVPLEQKLRKALHGHASLSKSDEEEKKEENHFSYNTVLLLYMKCKELTRS